MTAVQILFLGVGMAAVLSAMLVVTVRNLIHAALWLVVTLFSVAITFVLLDAGFLATVQVVLYIGAIAILIIFAIMLTRRVMMADSGPQTHTNWWLGALLTLLLFAAVIWLIWQTNWPQLPEADLSGVMTTLGHSLVDPEKYVLPFEVASIMLLAALIGAVAIAWPGKNRS